MGKSKGSKKINLPKHGKSMESEDEFMGFKDEIIRDSASCKSVDKVQVVDAKEDLCEGNSRKRGARMKAEDFFDATSARDSLNGCANTGDNPNITGDGPCSVTSNHEKDSDMDSFLAGFSTSDDDSDNDDAVNHGHADPQVLHVNNSKLQGDVNSPLLQRTTEVSATVYIGRIPHGFYSAQMHAYFSQFGEIKRLRMARNKKTGHSKHYAFIEFKSPEVAEVVAKTMHNYLLYGHILQVHLMPSQSIHKDLWKGVNKRFRVIPRNKFEMKHLEKPVSESVWNKRINNEMKRRKKKKSILEHFGYEFDMPILKPPCFVKSSWQSPAPATESPDN